MNWLGLFRNSSYTSRRNFPGGIDEIPAEILGRIFAADPVDQLLVGHEETQAFDLLVDKVLVDERLPDLIARLLHLLFIQVGRFPWAFWLSWYAFNNSENSL